MKFYIIGLEQCSRISATTDILFLSAVNSIKMSDILYAETNNELETLVEQFADDCADLRNPYFEIVYC